MNRFITAFLLIASLSLSVAYGAEKDNTQNLPQNFEHVFDGDVAHTAGGLWSRFLVIEEWANACADLTV